MKIVIFASIGAENIGDELILKNEIKILKEMYRGNNPQFIVFSYDYKNPFFKDKNIIYKEYFPIGLSNFKNFFKNFKNFFIFLKIIIFSDLIVIGGGGLFFDTEVGSKKNPLNLWLLRINIIKFFRKKIYFFRIGLSIKKQESFLKIKKIFSYKNSIIELRDDYSYKILNDLGIGNIIKKYDPVFFDKLDNFSIFEDEYIRKILNKKITIKKIFKNFSLKDLQDIDFFGKKVGIAFRSGYLSNNKDLEILMIKEIIEFIQKKGGKIILIPHSFSKCDTISNDFIWMQEISNNMKNISISKNLEETYLIYKNQKVDIILAQRLHSIILSQVYEIPFVAINYSKKTEEVLREIK